MTTLESLQHDIDWLKTQLANLDGGTKFGASSRIIGAEFISPIETCSEVVPTETGFTGAAMGGTGWTFGASTYQFVGVAAGVLQTGMATDGKMYAGQGNVVLDANGIYIIPGAAGIYDPLNSIRWDLSGVNHGLVTSFYTAGENQLQVRANAVTGKNSSLLLWALPPSGKDAQVEIYAGAVGSGVGASIYVYSGATGDVTINQGLTVTNGHVRSYGGTSMPDDSAVSFTPTKTSGLIIFGTQGANSWGQAFYNTGGPTMTAHVLGSTTEVNTIALTGTNGTDGKFTVSTWGGQIYMENRIGSARTPYVILI
jgi:hypothetical protein